MHAPDGGPSGFIHERPGCAILCAAALGVVLASVAAATLTVTCWPDAFWFYDHAQYFCKNAAKEPPWLQLSGLSAAPAILLTWFWRDQKRRHDERTADANRAATQADAEKAREADRAVAFATRFKNAAEMLAARDVMTRVNAAHLLWDIARESPPHRATVADTLVRFFVIQTEAHPGRTAEDLNCITTVLSRNDWSSEDWRVQGRRVGLSSKSHDLVTRARDLGLLADALLAGVDFRGASLTEADFSRANLTGAALDDADLSRANLRGVTLSRASLTAANLAGANLTCANLEGDVFTGVDLTGVDPTEDSLTGGVLAGAVIMGDFITGDVITGAANLARANLTGAILLSAKLAGANMTHANLAHADLTRADLTRANLAHANLTHAQFIRANLTRAHLTRASLTGANMTHANLVHADLTRADLVDANLTGADLTGANLAGANVRGADFTGAKGVDLAGVRVQFQSDASALAEVSPDNEHATISAEVDQTG